MNHASRPDWRRWLAATRHPARQDGVIAVALVVLPWVMGVGPQWNGRGRASSMSLRGRAGFSSVSAGPC
jgi:hypothetical protein